jgi:hypothetical protein
VAAPGLDLRRDHALGAIPLDRACVQTKGTRELTRSDQASHGDRRGRRLLRGAAA